MWRNRWLVSLVVGLVLAMLLSACGAFGAAPASLQAEPAMRAGGSHLAAVNGQPQEGIIVVGTGVANAEPQIAQVSFGVELQGKDPERLVSEAGQKMRLGFKVCW